MYDSGNRCFLFSLDMKEMFVPQDDNRLLLRHSGYGPVFGSGNGCDLSIVDQCNNSKNSATNFPATYNRAGIDKIENSQASWTMLSGAKEGYRFKVVEYEVFQAIYE